MSMEHFVIDMTFNPMVMHAGLNVIDIDRNNNAFTLCASFGGDGDSDSSKNTIDD